MMLVLRQKKKNTKTNNKKKQKNPPQKTNQPTKTPQKTNPKNPSVCLVFFGKRQKAGFEPGWTLKFFCQLLWFESEPV